MRHVLLVGATDGIGLALARRYLAERWRVGLVGRDPTKLDRVTQELREEHPDETLVPVECDVTDRGRVAPAFEEALRGLGQVDLLVYTAGVMPEGEGPEGRAVAAHAMLDVHASGAIRFLEHAAEYFVQAGRGHLAAVGSVAGERGRKGNPAYCASKAALHTYLEGLRHRLHGKGVTVSAIKPGWVNTRMLGEDAPPVAVSPEEAAERIYRQLLRGREEFFVPAWWRGVGLVLRLLPRWLFLRIGPA